MPEKDINKAYAKFGEILKSYGLHTDKFMRDCVYIAHSNGDNGFKGLRKQGYDLTLAAVLFDDSLHLAYEKGYKSVDLYYYPALNKINVTLCGFDPTDKYAQTTKTFRTSDGSDAFANFIENLPNYTGESRMKKCSMSKKIESLRKKKNEDASQYVDLAKKKVEEEYADEYGVFTDVYEMLNDKAYELADDIIAENGIDESAREEIHEAVYDEFCKTTVTLFGGVNRD